MSRSKVLSMLAISSLVSYGFVVYLTNRTAPSTEEQVETGLHSFASPSQENAAAKNHSKPLLVTQTLQIPVASEGAVAVNAGLSDPDTEVNRQLITPEEEERGQAIQAAVVNLGDKSRDLVLAALQDKSPSVREQALRAAQNSPVNLSDDQLFEIAQSDPSDTVRLRALEALGKSTDEQSQAQRLELIQELAHNSPEALIREQATQMAEDIIASSSSTP